MYVFFSYFVYFNEKQKTFSVSSVLYYEKEEKKESK